MATLDGDRLRQLRLDAGMSQAKLTATVGTRPHLVGQWERGDTQPTPEQLEQLAMIFGVQVGMLLRRST